MERLRAILGQRCPRCFQGRAFDGLFSMRDYCPACGLKFEREQGYFLGAMYVSYALAMVLIAVFTLALVALLPSVRYEVAVLLAFIPYLLCVPAVFRYSRVIWMHFDRWCNPSTFDEKHQAPNS
jgi:uncharacterized protein (DUF983 family)